MPQRKLVKKKNVVLNFAGSLETTPRVMHKAVGNLFCVCLLGEECVFLLFVHSSI